MPIKPLAAHRITRSVCLFVILCWPLSPCADWLARSPEGSWLRVGDRTLFLEQFSPWPLAANLALVAGSKMLSGIPGNHYQQLPLGGWLMAHGPDCWHWLSRISAGLGAAWYLSSAVDSLGLISTQNPALVVNLELPDVRDKILVTLHGSEEPHFSFIRNPLVEAEALITGGDAVTRELLGIHKEMARGGLERLEIKPFIDGVGAGLRLGWRTRLGQWFWLTPTERILSETPVQWLELSDPDGVQGGAVISLFQPQLLNFIAQILRRGRSTGVTLAGSIAPLVVDRTEGGSWSANLAAGGVPVMLQGRFSGEQQAFLKLHRAGVDAGGGSLYRIPRFWTALGQSLINLGSVLVDYRPDYAVAGQPAARRLRLLLSGKAGVIGLAAMTGREVKGRSRTLVAESLPRNSEHRRRLKDSNRVLISEQLFQELVREEVQLPWQFELTGCDGNKAWVTPEQVVDIDSNKLLLPQHVMNRLNISPSHEVSLQPVKLEPAKNVVFKVLEGVPRNQDQLADIVSLAMNKRYPILHQGEVIRTLHDGQMYSFAVQHLSPAGAAYTYELNLPVYFECPKNWQQIKNPTIVKTKKTEPFSTPGRVLLTGKLVQPKITYEHKAEPQPPTEPEVPGRDLDDPMSTITGDYGNDFPDANMPETGKRDVATQVPEIPLKKEPEQSSRKKAFQSFSGEGYPSGRRKKPGNTAPEAK